MKRIKLFEQFVNETNYWETQVGDFLKSNGRDLEAKDDLKDADIEKFVNAFEMKYKTQPEIHDKIVDHVRVLLNYPGDFKWIDPAGGIHDDGEEDPAKMYEDNSVKAK